MKLAKVAGLSSVSVSIKIISMFVIGKMLAIYAGPVGYASIGQFQNFMQMAVSFSSAGMNIGVIKYTADFSEKTESQRAIWSTAGTISFVCSIIAACCIFIFSGRLTLLLLNDPSLKFVFVCLSICMVFISFNALFISALNGMGEIKKYVVANTLGSLLSLIISVMLIHRYSLYGGLIALTLGQAVGFTATLAVCYRCEWFRLSYFLGGIDKSYALKLSQYSLMTVIGVICIPISQILVRGIIADNLGAEFAGYWDAMWKLSATYLLFVTSTLSVYYLPKLTKTHSPTEMRDEIVNGYKFMLPICFVLGSILYVMQDFVIRLLFTDEFLPMGEIFGWQLFGDTIKIASWLLGYIITAKSMVKFFMISEIFYAILFVVFMNFFVQEYGFKGAGIAHSVTYIFHFLYIFLVVRRIKFS